MISPPNPKTQAEHGPPIARHDDKNCMVTTDDAVSDDQGDQDRVTEENTDMMDISDALVLEGGDGWSACPSKGGT